MHRLAEVPRCSCCPWTASWRAQRRHCSNEAQRKTIDARLTVVAAESSLTHSGVIGPVTRVSPDDEAALSTAVRRRGCCTCCVQCWERIWERNAA
jgi:hypothetical protein